MKDVKRVKQLVELISVVKASRRMALLEQKLKFIGSFDDSVVNP